MQNRLRRNRKRNTGRGFESLEPRQLLTVVPELALAFDIPTVGRSTLAGDGGTLVFSTQEGDLFSTTATAQSPAEFLGSFHNSALRTTVSLNGRTFFTTEERESGRWRTRIWETDGTRAGTVEVFAVEENLSDLVVSNDALFLLTRDSLIEIDPVSFESTTLTFDDRSSIDQLFVANNQLFALGTRIRIEHPRGVQLELISIQPDNSIVRLAEFDLFSSVFREFHVLDDQLYFLSQNNTGGFDLWTSDGSPEGTMALADVGASRQLDMVEFNDNHYFIVDNSGGTRFDSNALWITDATPDGTRSLVDMTRDGSLTNRYYSTELIAGEASIYFADQRGRLWSTDGTETGTSILLDTPEANNRPIGNLREIDGNVWFVQRNQDTRHGALWKSDGSPDGTEQIWQFDRSLFNSYVIDEALVLLAADEIWRYELGTTISGTAWIDENGNGERDATEATIAGIELLARNEQGEVIATGKTDAGGHYQLVVAPGARYQVEATPPTNGALSAAGDDDVGPGGSTPLMQVDASRAGIDVAIQLNENQGIVRGQVWLDRNVNGEPDSGELPLVGAPVQLLDGIGIVVETTSSDESGWYEFNVPTADNYQIRALPTDATLLGPRGTSALSMQNHRIDGNGAPFATSDQSSATTINIGHYETRLIPPSRYEPLGSENSNHLLFDFFRITELDIRRNRSFIELANLSDNVVLNLRDVRFLEGVGFDFTHGDVTQLFPGERVVVVEDLEQFATDYDTSDILVAGEYLGGLRWDELLILSAPINQEIHIMQLDVENWFPRTRRANFTIAIADESSELSRWGEQDTWRISERPEGSPGKPDQAPFAKDVVVISEIMSNPAANNNDWIELHNTTDEPIDIGGWFLGDDTDGNPAYYRFVIPQGTVIEPQGYVTFNRFPDFGFGLSSFGETLHLTAADEQGPLGYGQSIRFSGARPDMTFGRFITPEGEAVMVPLESATKGAENSAPATGPVVFTEIMLQPAFTQDRFVELQNVTDDPVNVRVGDVTRQLEPRQILVIVDIDPDEFRQKYDIPPTVQVAFSRTVARPDRFYDLEAFTIHAGGRATLIDRVGLDLTQVPVDGASIEREMPELGYGDSSTSWRLTDRLGGTPGNVPGSPGFRIAGDANGDGVFDSSDLVQVFRAGTYENPEATDVTFAEGDWNGDGVFDSSDLVAAFRDFRLDL